MIRTVCNFFEVFFMGLTAQNKVLAHVVGLDIFFARHLGMQRSFSMDHRIACYLRIIPLL